MTITPLMRLDYEVLKKYPDFHLLVFNKGRVLTYEQIYQRLWGEEAFGNENNAVGYCLETDV